MNRSAAASFTDAPPFFLERANFICQVRRSAPIAPRQPRKASAAPWLRHVSAIFDHPKLQGYRCASVFSAMLQAHWFHEPLGRGERAFSPSMTARLVVHHRKPVKSHNPVVATKSAPVNPAAPPFGRIPMALFLRLGSNGVLIWGLLNLDKHPIRGAGLCGLGVLMFIRGIGLMLTLSFSTTWGWWT